MKKIFLTLAIAAGMTAFAQTSRSWDSSFIGTQANKGATTTNGKAIVKTSVSTTGKSNSTASTTMKSTNAPTKTHPVPNLHGETYVFRNGKVVHLENGKSSPITKDVTFDNGTVLMVNGTLKTKDGKETKLSEGQHVGKNGSIIGKLPPKNTAEVK